MTSVGLRKKADAVIIDCASCKKSPRDIRITDILILAVRHNELRTEFRKLQGKDQNKNKIPLGSYKLGHG